MLSLGAVFFFSSRRRHTRFKCDWSSDVCSSDLEPEFVRAVGGVDIDQDDAGSGGGVLHEDPLDAVTGPDAGAVAGGESEAGESAGDAGGFAIEFTPGEADVLMADDEGFAVGATGGGVRGGFVACLLWAVRW